MFNSNYSTSNPFSFNKPTTNIEESLLQTYAQLEALKAKQAQFGQGNSQQEIQTVFTDISNEFKDISEDETNFIVNSQEYKTLNEKYQNEFSQFLISKFSTEYLQTTGNTRTLEEMLYTIRTKKEDYKQRFAKDINEIREMNKELLEKNNALASSNLELQEQIKTLLKGI
jgi:hypothetical protein